ncbi:unnamed protein product [Lymnaea stagnalis]|uniref:MD-2-related lipid-recognition domain-containing protein n=1 Tax=Lymnaea stagnalis TaxID=6523 RepID=A0AAV2HXK3_LYMST
MAPRTVLWWALALVLSVCLTCRAVRVTSCSKDPSTDIVKVRSFSASPTTIRLPGNLTISGTFAVSQPITGNLLVDVTITKNMGGMWIDLPCVPTPLGNLGSCTYRDFCQILAKANSSCPKIVTDMGLPCSCPIPAGTYDFQQTTIPLDLKILGFRIPGISGEYQASIRVTDADTMTEFICFDVELELSEPAAPSIFRNIGRFFVNLFGR